MKFFIPVALLQLCLINSSSICPNQNSNEPAPNLQDEQTPGETKLDILAADGIKLKATYYSPGKPGPGILLLHQCNLDRKSWQSLAASLANKGIHVLTFDYRGYGETPANGNLYEHIKADVDSAFAKLIVQPGVDKDRMAAGGASCGVSNSMQLAIRNNRIKALFLLTGPMPEQAATYIKSHPGVPILAIENGDEVAAVKELDAVIKLSKNPSSMAKAYSNGAHGVPIFNKHPDIIPTVTNWLVDVLK